MFKKIFSIITVFFNLLSAPFVPFSDSTPKDTPVSEVYVEETTTHVSNNSITETTSVFFEENTSNSETAFRTEENTEASTTEHIFLTTETTTQKAVSAEIETVVETEKTNETTSVQKNLSKETNNYYPDSNTVALCEKINNYRKANGLNTLILDEELCQLAYIRAMEQAENKGHIRPDGSRFLTVFVEYNVIYKTVGENIAISSYNDIDRMFNGWHDSETHNKNMLDERWVRTGIALYVTDSGRYCFVQLFSTAN